MTTPARVTPVKHTAKKKKPHVVIQRIPKRLFGPNPRCVSNGSASSRLKKTPHEDPEKCLGSVRLGGDGKYLYIARRLKKKNPHIKYSSVPTGIGYHIGFKWEKIYDARTGKAFKASDLPKMLAVLS